MNSHIKYFIAFLGSLFLALGCSFDTGNLSVIGDMPMSLKEISAVEIAPNSDLFWVIEDSGNRPIVFGLDSIGNIKHSIEVTNARNRDWEDLTSDAEGNLYIGDFGNNRRSSNSYTIYKLKNLSNFKSEAEIIKFELPDEDEQRDFEAFFEYGGMFYIFSKEDEKFQVYSVENSVGNHTANLVKSFKLEGENNKITSADISNDGKTVVLLNHSKLWKLSNYKNRDFFSGNVDAIPFNHASQKEGICFGANGDIFITDENSGMQGGNIYTMNIEKN